MILGLDGLHSLAGQIDRDTQLMLLLHPLTSSVTSAVTRQAAFTMGKYMELYPRPEDEKSINVWISNIKDPLSEGGRITLWALALDDGYETIPGLVRQDLANAVAVRLGKITAPEERLWMLRILRTQRAELEGATGLGWVRGPAVDALKDLLKSKDPSYLVDAILSLGLTDPAPGQPNAEPAEMRAMVDEKFISLASHTDPRLRLLAARYLANNNPPGRNEALSALAGDEYPAIAKEAVILR
jgi:hypothetical protein